MTQRRQAAPPEYSCWARPAAPASWPRHPVARPRGLPSVPRSRPREALGPLLLFLLLPLAQPATEGPRAACRWCAGMPDGYHADVHALPPCSGYYRCMEGQLAQVRPCPWGMCYSGTKARCVERSQCRCGHERRPAVKEGPRPGSNVGPKGLYPGRMNAQSGDEEPGFPVLQLGRGLSARLHIGSKQGREPVVYHGGTKWDQVNALLAFKLANWDPGNKLGDWVVPRPVGDPHFVCTWSGVNCTGALGPSDSVAVLTLSNPGLLALQTLWGRPAVHQSIPPQFGDLTALESLDLSYSGAAGDRGVVSFGGLVGSIPAQLGRLTRLSRLNLLYNSLTGPLPKTLSNLVSLQYLNLRTNRLAGPVPPALGRLSALTFLDLSYNNFSGSVPASLGQLSSLSELHINFTPLGSSLPGALGALSSLTLLELRGNPGLGGSVPSSLSRLSALCLLYLAKMPLTGSLGAWLSSLSSLQVLSLTNTRISGRVPAAWPHTLDTLELGANRFSGAIPRQLRSSLCAPNRTVPFASLVLRDNSLRGPFPSFLSACTALNNLDVSNNRHTGGLPSSLASSFPALEALLAANNSLQGPLPHDAFKHPRLVQLVLSGNNFSGTPPPLQCSGPMDYTVQLDRNTLAGDIGKFLSNVSSCAAPSSLVLNITWNRFHGRLPRGFLEGSTTQFSASWNQLSGPLPPPMNCSSLTDFAAAHNRLSGELPPEYTQGCAALKTLDLSGNRLASGIPEPEPGSLASLRLSGNALLGPVPGTMSRLAFLTELDLSQNNLSGSFPASLAELPSLMSLDLGSNTLQGSIPSQLANLLFLTSLSAAGNALAGPIPPELAPPFLPHLVLLNLSHNRLEGPIPYGFAFPPGVPLQLDLSSNNLSGQVPGGSSSQLSSPSASLSGNPGLCGGAGYEPCPVPQPAAAPPLSPGEVVGIVLGCVGGLVLIGLGALALLHRDEWSSGATLIFRDTEPPISGRLMFDLTEGFSDQYLLGTGGFGSVYKATLADGTVLAIKRLNSSSSQGETEFTAEMQCLGTLSHRNLVSLYGAYIAVPPSEERLLIYEYLPGGSLDTILQAPGGVDPGSPLCQWEVRLRILRDVARALKYLHNDCKPPIIHRDVKPPNILLSRDLVAKVADFGLAKEAELGRTQMSAEIVGTVGYLAPEYACFGRMGFKSDVFAFGVTMLQVITGRSPTDEEVAERGLSRWIGSHAAVAIADPGMAFEEEEADQILGAIQLGLRCIMRVPVDRPSMDEVSHTLDHMGAFAEGIGAKNSKNEPLVAYGYGESGEDNPEKGEVEEKA